MMPPTLDGPGTARVPNRAQDPKRRFNMNNGMNADKPMYAGGSKTFDERTGKYNNKPTFGSALTAPKTSVGSIQSPIKSGVM